MSVFKSRLSLMGMLCLTAVVGFAGGMVSARGAFPSVERAVNDYGTLSSDLSAAIDEANKKKQAASQENLLKLKSHIHDMEAEFERMKESQEHMNDIWKDLEKLFGPNGNNNTSAAPERKRP